jgi:alkylhydroperoxidase family enzyme
VEAVLSDWRTAAVDDRLRATLGFLEKLTLDPDTVTADDARVLRQAGLGEAAIEDAIQVCVLFNVYDRLADSFEFDIPDRAGFAQSATRLLDRGYLM